MPFNTNLVACPPGEWISICEMRPGRKALMVEFLSGAVVLSPTKNLPMVDAESTSIPAGFLLDVPNSTTPAIFELHANTHGDLVEQEWFAWVLAVSLPPSSGGNIDFNSSDTWEAPADATIAEIYAYGSGGATWDSDPLVGATPGGGGGAYAETLDFVLIPGHTYTIQIEDSLTSNPIAEPIDTWFSATGIAPLNVAEGVLAKSATNGTDAATATPGVGGDSSLCIGDLVSSGFAGGGVAAYVPLMGNQGGQGGGNGIPIDTGEDGADGLDGPHGLNNAATFAGAAGGGSDGIATTDGAMGIEFTGCGGAGLDEAGTPGLGAAPVPALISLVWYTAPSTPIITVLESFEIAPQGVEEKRTITVPLPRLSEEGIRHLRSLQEKLAAKTKGANPDVRPDTPEHD